MAHGSGTSHAGAVICDVDNIFVPALNFRKLGVPSSGGYCLLTVPICPTAPLYGVVDVLLVAERKSALHEEEDGERVEGRDERDGERVAAALAARADPVAAHDGGRGRGDVRVGRHLGADAYCTRARARQEVVTQEI